MTYAIDGNAMQMNDPIPQEEKVLVQHLPNGVKTYIQENAQTAQTGSFKVVFKKSSRDEVLYSYDGNDWDQIELFFDYCKKKATYDRPAGEILFDECHYACSDLPAFRMNFPQEVAVIAVGDFSREEMLVLIAKHFSDIPLSPQNEGPTIQIDSDASINKVALRVSFPNAPLTIGTYQDLNEGWKQMMLQELYQHRLERCSRSLDESWIHPHPRFFYPVKGYAVASEEISENLLSYILWQIELMRNDGFHEDEFYLIKRNLLNQLQYLESNTALPNNAFLSSYFADQFLLGDRCPCYESFLTASAQLIEEMQFDDLKPHIGSFLADDNLCIRVVYPETALLDGMTEHQIEKVIKKIASLSSFYRNSEIKEDAIRIFDSENSQALEDNSSIDLKEIVIDLPPSVELLNDLKPALFRVADGAPVILLSNAAGSVDAYYQLPLNDKEKRIIRSIFTTMAEKNIIQLALEKRTMEKKGKKVTHVHPMRFIGYIFSNPELKSCMRKIVKSSFKWDAFVDGFSKRMKEEFANNNLHRHIPGFCQEVGADPAQVARFIERKDWEGLARSLL